MSSAVIDKAATILGLVRRKPMLARDIAAELNMTRSTCYRLLRSLESHKFIEKRVGGVYVLGSFPNASSGPTDAVEPLRKIRDETSESALLWIQRGTVRVCVLKADSPHELRISRGAGTALYLSEGGSAALALLGPCDGQTVFSTREGRAKGAASASVGFSVRHRDALSPVDKLAVSVSFPIARAPENFEMSFGESLRTASAMYVEMLPDSEALALLRSVAFSVRI